MSIISRIKNFLDNGIAIVLPSLETAPKDIALIRSDRTCCPFYGFHFAGLGAPAMLDQDGNQCSLITDSYSPCQYVYERDNPHWPCKFFSKEFIPSFIEHKVKVFPNELGNQGISFKAWSDEIVRRGKG